MESLAYYLLLALELADPSMPKAIQHGAVSCDDRGGVIITGPGWVGVGRILPNGRSMHLVWTPRQSFGRVDALAYPGYYSWDWRTQQWRGYYGTSGDPYTRTDYLIEK